jgi:hypothetical protein
LEGMFSQNQGQGNSADHTVISTQLVVTRNWPELLPSAELWNASFGIFSKLCNKSAKIRRAYCTLLWIRSLKQQLWPWTWTHLLWLSDFSLVKWGNTRFDIAPGKTFCNMLSKCDRWFSPSLWCQNTCKKPSAGGSHL